MDVGQRPDPLGQGPFDGGVGVAPAGQRIPALLRLLPGLAVADQTRLDLFEARREPPATLLDRRHP